MLNVLVENTCRNYLRGAQPSHRPKIPRPSWSHVGATFRSWALLGRVVRFLLRLLSLLAAFCASWSTPGLILEGSRRVRGGFWSVRAPSFRGFCARARLQCPHALNVTKPQFYWIGTHFASNAHHARNCEKSLQQPFERGYLRWSCPKCVLEFAGLVFGGVWEPSKPVLGASWTLLGSFCAPFKRLLGAF